MPPSFLEFVLDLSTEQIADLQHGAPDTLTDLVSGAIARLVIETERAKDRNAPDPEWDALVLVHQRARHQHEKLRRRRQPVSGAAVNLAVSAVAVAATRPQKAARSLRTRTSSTNSSGSDDSECSDPPSAGVAAVEAGGTRQRVDAPAPGSADLRHISHGLLAALMMSPKPLTIETLEALTSRLSPAERCELEAHLPASLSSELWQPIKAELVEMA